MGIILFSPVMAVLYFWIVSDSKGGFIFKQERMGQFAKPFNIYKIRSMYVEKRDDTKLITVGEDSRITRPGKFIRKYKLDELPQLFNVLLGDISLVGPRPEVFKYREYYSGAYEEILSIKPGITDPASIQFIDESTVLANATDPEKAYTEVVLPKKLSASLAYAKSVSFSNDLRIILRTIAAIFR